MTPEQLALDNCAQEPVHVPGKIQSFGALLGFNAESFSVEHVSTNTSMIGLPDAPGLLGQPLGHALDNRSLIHAVRGALGLPTIAIQRERIGQFDLPGGPCEAALSVAADCGILELEPVVPDSSRPAPALARVRTMLASITGSGDSLAELLDAACVALRHNTGYDRVMAYRFLANDDGEVVAEAKAPYMSPWLGLRYPAADIPPQVRALMVRMPYRVTTDIDDAQAALVSLRDFTQLDLSLTHLRGLSPVHCEYLRNMGVQATANIGVVVKGRLWGMFALHHGDPFLPKPDQRSMAELFAQLISFQIQQHTESASLSRRERIRSTLSGVLTPGVETTTELFTRFAPQLRALVGADGIALVEDGEVIGEGSIPAPEVTSKLISKSGSDALLLDKLTSVEAIHELLVEKGEGLLEPVAGALCTSMQPNINAQLIFFRDAIAQHVRWAGKNEKTVALGPDGPRIEPRTSFAEYLQAVEGQCEPWLDADVAAAQEVSATFRDAIVGARLKDAQAKSEVLQHQNLLIGELNHRVRNVLALVRSIASQSMASAGSLAEYASAFEQRLTALAFAHDLVGSDSLQQAPLEQIITAELAPYSSDSLQLTCEGPEVSLTSKVASTMTLVLHELVSNAVKHGALASNGRALSVTWSRSAGGLALIWQEWLDRPLAPPSRRGFGLSLIERAIPHEVSGRCDVSFEPSGLKVEIWLPDEVVAENRCGDGHNSAGERRNSGCPTQC